MLLIAMYILSFIGAATVLGLIWGLFIVNREREAVEDDEQDWYGHG